jgi:ATP-dependent DNA helicase RecQ
VTDEVLRRIVRELPREEDALLAVEGVGPVLVRKCGRALLEAVASHLAQLDLASAMEASRGSVAQLPQNLRLTFELCVQGLSLSAVAERRGLTEGTVSGHVAELIDRGVRLDLDRLVAPERQDAIRRAASSLRKPDMKRIKAVLEEDVSYAEIRVMLAAMKRG